MSHPNQPMYYVLSNIDSYNGNTNVIGIFESMRALSFRLQRVYSTCGDEYHIDCLHLQTAELEAEELTEQTVSRVKYQRENKIKDRLYEEYNDNKEGFHNIIENKETVADEELAAQLREERLDNAA